jgi:hypothetical protein
MRCDNLGGGISILLYAPSLRKLQFFMCAEHRHSPDATEIGMKPVAVVAVSCFVESYHHQFPGIELHRYGLMCWWEWYGSQLVPALMAVKIASRCVSPTQ